MEQHSDHLCQFWVYFRDFLGLLCRWNLGVLFLKDLHWLSDTPMKAWWIAISMKAFDVIHRLQHPTNLTECSSLLSLSNIVIQLVPKYTRKPVPLNFKLETDQPFNFGLRRLSLRRRKPFNNAFRHHQLWLHGHQNRSYTLHRKADKSKSGTCYYRCSRK